MNRRRARTGRLPVWLWIEPQSEAGASVLIVLALFVVGAALLLVAR
jgi:hypothetical protein